MRQEHCRAFRVYDIKLTPGFAVIDFAVQQKHRRQLWIVFAGKVHEKEQFLLECHLERP